MTDIQILKELMKSSESKNKKQDSNGSEDENNTQRTQSEDETSSEGDNSSTLQENLDSSASLNKNGSLSDKIQQVKNPDIKDAEDDDASEYGDDEQDFLLDMDEQRVQMENMSTLLSMFFQDDRGLNVVEAIVQNSKVQNKISKSLDKVIDILMKK